MSDKAIVLQLNELNVELLEIYIQAGYSFPNFLRVLSNFYRIETSSEDRYEEIEPWIQWVSFYTGRKAQDHRVLTLDSDALRQFSYGTQLFDLLEKKGERIGVLGSMNAQNTLKNPSYFIPDPWSSTKAGGSFLERRITSFLQQVVNDNSSGRISSGSAVVILLIYFSSVFTGAFMFLTSCLFKALARRWARAAFLDGLIHAVDLIVLRWRRPTVAFSFFNAAAHIQHHYLFNSSLVNTKRVNPDWYVPAKDDPVLEVYRAYDRMLGGYFEISKKLGYKLAVVTGLSQIPYDRVKFYYRLRNHHRFLQRIGISYTTIRPRMTRDFEVDFANQNQLADAFSTLSSARLARDRQLVFRVHQQPNSLSLFITLVYPGEILESDELILPIQRLRISEFFLEVVFVALKNGMHSPKGYALVEPGFAKFQQSAANSSVDRIPVWMLGERLFGIPLGQ